MESIVWTYLHQRNCVVSNKDLRKTNMIVLFKLKNKGKHHINCFLYFKISKIIKKKKEAIPVAAQIKLQNKK